MSQSLQALVQEHKHANEKFEHLLESKKREERGLAHWRAAAAKAAIYAQDTVDPCEWGTHTAEFTRCSEAAARYEITLKSVFDDIQEQRATMADLSVAMAKLRANGATLITKETVRDMAKSVVASHHYGRKFVVEILSEHGATNVSGLPPEEYPAVLMKLASKIT